MAVEEANIEEQNNQETLVEETPVEETQEAVVEGATPEEEVIGTIEKGAQDKFEFEDIFEYGDVDTDEAEFIWNNLGRNGYEKYLNLGYDETGNNYSKAKKEFFTNLQDDDYRKKLHKNIIKSSSRKEIYATGIVPDSYDDFATNITVKKKDVGLLDVASLLESGEYNSLNFPVEQIRRIKLKKDNPEGLKRGEYYRFNNYIYTEKQLDKIMDGNYDVKPEYKYPSLFTEKIFTPEVKKELKRLRESNPQEYFRALALTNDTQEFFNVLEEATPLEDRGNYLDKAVGAYQAFVNAIARGFENNEQAQDVFKSYMGYNMTDLVKEIADSELKKRQLQGTDEYQKFQQSESWWETFLNLTTSKVGDVSVPNPLVTLSVGGQLIAEQLAMFLPATFNYGKFIIPPSALAGATAGSTLGPGGASGGALTGTIWGVRGSVGVAAFALESSGGILEQLSKPISEGGYGVNITNPDELLAAFENEEIMQKLREDNTAKPAVVAALEMVSAGIAGKVQRGAKNLGYSPKGAYALEIGAHSSLGAGGEYIGSLVGGKDISPVAIVSEIVAQPGQAVAWATVNNFYSTVKSQLVSESKGVPEKLPELNYDILVKNPNILPAEKQSQFVSKLGGGRALTESEQNQYLDNFTQQFVKMVGITKGKIQGLGAIQWSQEVQSLIGEGRINKLIEDVKKDIPKGADIFETIQFDERGNRVITFGVFNPEVVLEYLKTDKKLRLGNKSLKDGLVFSRRFINKVLSGKDLNQSELTLLNRLMKYEPLNKEQFPDGVSIEIESVDLDADGNVVFDENGEPKKTTSVINTNNLKENIKDKDFLKRFESTVTYTDKNGNEQTIAGATAVDKHDILIPGSNEAVVEVENILQKNNMYGPGKGLPTVEVTAEKTTTKEVDITESKKPVTIQQQLDKEVSREALKSIIQSIRKSNPNSSAVDILTDVYEGNVIEDFNYDYLNDDLTYDALTDLLVSEEIFDNKRQAIDKLSTIGKGVVLKDIETVKTEEPSPSKTPTVEETAEKTSEVNLQLKAHEETGGSTFNEKDGNLTGNPFLMVSIFPERSKILEKGTPLTKEILEDFKKENKDLLDANENISIGTYVADDGKTYIDLSVTIPKDKKDVAIDLAKKYNQISIFDLETLEDIKTGGTGENVGGLPNEQQRIQDLNNLLKPKETITAQEIKTAGKKPRQKIKNFFKKYFTPKGLLNEETFGKKLKRGFKLKKEERRVKYNIREIKDQIRSALREDKSLNKDNLLITISSVLKGEGKYTDLPSNVADAVREARRHIDSYSQRILDEGVIEGIDVESIEQTITENLDSYLNRSYRIFDDKNWGDNVPDSAVEAAKKFIMEKHPDLSEGEAAGLVSEILKQTYGNPNFLTSIPSEGKNINILKGKKEIPIEIRELMGEYVDPLKSYASTVLKMASLVETSSFLKSVKEDGMDVWLYDKPIVKDGVAYNTPIAAEGSETFSPLGGLYTTPELAETFKGLADRKNKNYGLSSLYLKLNGLVKGNLTIASVQTIQRNFLGNVGFGIVNGHWDLGQMNVAMKTTANDLLNLNKKQFNEKMLRYVDLGIIDESALAGDIMSYLQEDANLNLDIEKMSTTRLGKVKNAAKKGYKKLGEVYQSMDNVWKIYAYENELNRYTEAYVSENNTEFIDSDGKPNQALKEKVANIVRNTYPTYSLTPEAVNMIRKFPIFGTFVSFPAEVMRTSFKTFNTAVEEYGSDNPKVRDIGAKRIQGMMVAGGLFSTMGAVSMAALGISDEEEEAIKNTSVAPWSEGSDLVYVESNEDGIKYVDIGYTNPHNMYVKMLNKLLAGEEITTENIGDAAMEFFLPFFGEDILTQALREVASNKDENGKQIFNPESDLGDQAYDIFSHVGGNFLPKTVVDINKIFKGVRGSKSKSGREYDPATEITSMLTGQRIVEVKYDDSLTFGMLDFKKRFDNAVNIYKAKVRDKSGDVTEEDKIEAYKEANEKALNILVEMSEYYKDILLLMSGGTFDKKLSDKFKDRASGLTVGDKEYDELKLEHDKKLKTAQRKIFNQLNELGIGRLPLAITSDIPGANAITILMNPEKLLDMYDDLVDGTNYTGLLNRIIEDMPDKEAPAVFEIGKDAYDFINIGEVRKRETKEFDPTLQTEEEE